MRRYSRLLLRAYPRAWRERYGAELLDLLQGSRRPLRDTVDVLRSAAALRDDAFWRRTTMRTIMLLGAGLVALGILWITWAIPQLTHGPAELPGHWWSSPGLLLLTTGLALTVTAATRRRRKKP